MSIEVIKWRLINRRAVNERTGRLLPHSTSRHMDVGGDILISPAGVLFSQGDLFPKSVHAGAITQIERLVEIEWKKWRGGEQSNIREVKDAGGANRVVVSIRKFGVRAVGAFIRHNTVCTIFPEEASGSSFITRDDKKLKKSKFY